MDDENTDRTKQETTAGSLLKAEALMQELAPRQRAMLQRVLESYPSLSIEEALAQVRADAAQRYFELAAHIEQLTTLRNDWRGRALAAENEVARLLEREAALLALIDSRSAAALKQAELYKTILREISAQQASGSKVLVGGFAALDEAGLYVNIGLPNLAALVAALTKSGTAAAERIMNDEKTENETSEAVSLTNAADQLKNLTHSIDEAIAQLRAAGGI
jgi:hypothetical protein